MRSCEGELREIANELKPSRKLENMGRSESPADTRPHEEMKQVLSRLRQHVQRQGDEEAVRQILVYYDALRDQIHTASKLAKSWRHAHQFLPVQLRFPYPRPAHLRLQNVLANLHANLTPRSAAFRHAIRLGVALALATALYQFFHLPRGYWVPLTAVLVLCSDFATTFTRGIARLVGTLLGAVLTTLLVVFLAPSHGALILIVAIAAYLSFSVLFANYALFSAIITMTVVFLLSFIYPQTLSFAAYRAIDTLIGGVLALLIYLLWPTWEHPQVAGNIADRVESLRRHFDAVLQGYANPKAYDPATSRKLRMETRLARSNAQASVQRSLQEPKFHRLDPDTAQGLLAAADNISRTVLALEAYLLDNPSHHALPGVLPVTRAFDEALDRLAEAIREMPSRVMCNVRPSQKGGL